jgi:hypothetical protein
MKLLPQPMELTATPTIPTIVALMMNSGRSAIRSAVTESKKKEK